jgi:integrase
MLDVLMKKYCEAAGIPAEKAHICALRHSAAVSLMKNGEDIVVVQDHVGHTNIANTAIYARSRIGGGMKLVPGSRRGSKSGCTVLGRRQWRQLHQSNALPR